MRNAAHISSGGVSTVRSFNGRTSLRPPRSLPVTAIRPAQQGLVAHGGRWGATRPAHLPVLLHFPFGAFSPIAPTGRPPAHPQGGGTAQ